MITIMFARLASLPSIALSFDEGSHLFHRNDAVKSMFLIEAGEARLIRHHEGGGAVVLQRATPGAILAEASLFTNNYHCDAIASTPVSARRIARSAVLNLFLTDPEFAQAWAIHLSGEVRSARRRAEMLSLRTVSERLDAWLLEHGPLPDRGSWKALAQEIGSSPEALYREIALRRE